MHSYNDWLLIFSYQQLSYTMQRKGKFARMEFPTVPQPLYTSEIIFILWESIIRIKIPQHFYHDVMQQGGFGI